MQTTALKEKTGKRSYTPKKGGNDPLLHKVPPQNLDAEASILSAILIDTDTTALFDILEMLTAAEFYKSAHQKIFEAIRSLVDRSEPVDMVTVKNYLQDTGELDTIGGAVYLSELVETAPYAVNIRHYATIIKNKASLRALIENANEISRRCFENPSAVDEVIDFAESSILKVAEHKVGKSFYKLNQIIQTNIETIETNQGKWITGVASGFEKLDNLTSGFQNSDLIILAARPSMGKTALALNFARNAALNSNVPAAVFSLEMSKEQLSMRLLTSEARINSFRLRSGHASRQDWIKITDAASLLENAPLYIDDSPGLTAMEIRAKARRMKKDKDIGLVIIDYMQLMRASSPGERRDLEISEISRSLKGLAKELDLPVIVLSQLNRAPEQSNDKRPMLSHLRESGSLEQDADVVLFIYRDEVYNKSEDNPNRGIAEVIIGKQRNGPVGKIHLQFDASYTRFHNLADDQYSDT
ncbi:MAG: replicative DNA helicase [Thermodesulfobacteriota bacterium]|nr:replicative DNA helicase [Thermodesulfobacteriota bacterium]